MGSNNERAIVRIVHKRSGYITTFVTHNAFRTPFADQSIEVVTCAFSLHHSAHDAALALLRESARIARRGVIVRSGVVRLVATRERALGLVVANRLLRHDGPLSVLRAYRQAEAQAGIDKAEFSGRARAEPYSAGPHA